MARTNTGHGAPPVSVVMAVRNEELELAGCIDSILASGYAGEVQVVVAVGPSEDATADVAQGLQSAGLIRTVDNPTGATAAGLNLAIAASAHAIVVRMDGHARMPQGYLDHAVAALETTEAANVGGRMVPRASEPFARAVAVAMSSPFGLGSVGHRAGGTVGPAESVYLGAFRREALEAVGGYDEHFVRAQDWELNYRLRQAGFVIWFVPEMQVPYSPRSSWRALATQMHSTGQWRREVMSIHRNFRSLRYLAPPTVVTLMLAGSIMGLAGVLTHTPLAWALVLPAAYVAGVLGASALLSLRSGAAAALRMPVVLATIHVSWGLGFIRGVR